MRTPLEDLLRRLITLGLPLSIGCGSSLNMPGPDGPIGPTCHGTATYDQVLAVSRPTQNPDAGYGVTIEDWDACVQAMQCAALCREAVPFSSAAQTVLACGVVTDAGDAATGGSDLDAGSEPSVDLHVAFTYYDCTGRRPAGFSPRRRCKRGSQVGRWFAEASVLEAASVPAFRRLATELEAHHAPARLVRAARRAVGEEIRHHRLTAAVARANGAIAQEPRIRTAPVRSLVAMAAENAREGCVRETFGAATAAFQARHAADPRLRAVMSVIARDEARHALLAWEVDAWARTALPPAGARRLTAARDAAARTLARELEAAPPPDRSLARALGLPSAPALRRLAGLARDLLWTAVG
jgi:hypothetical protein